LAAAGTGWPSLQSLLRDEGPPSSSRPESGAGTTTTATHALTSQNGVGGDGKKITGGFGTSFSSTSRPSFNPPARKVERRFGTISFANFVGGNIAQRGFTGLIRKKKKGPPAGSRSRGALGPGRRRILDGMSAGGGPIFSREPVGRDWIAAIKSAPAGGPACRKGGRSCIEGRGAFGLRRCRKMPI